MEVDAEAATNEVTILGEETQNEGNLSITKNKMSWRPEEIDLQLAPNGWKGKLSKIMLFQIFLLPLYFAFTYLEKISFNKYKLSHLNSGNDSTINLYHTYHEDIFSCRGITYEP